MMNSNRTDGGTEWQNNHNQYSQLPPTVTYPPPYPIQNQGDQIAPPQYGFVATAPSAPENAFPVGYPATYGQGSSSGPLPYSPTPPHPKGIENPGYEVNVENSAFRQNVPPVGFYTPVNNPPYDHDQTEPKYEDYEAQHLAGLDFTEKTIRLAFIRKVYSILSIQLLVVVSFIAVFVYSDGVKEFTQKNHGVIYGALGAYLITFLILACCEGVRRKAPHNFIFLSIFTLASAVMLGVITASSDEKAVLLAGGVTVVVCVSLTLFSFQTKIDFTRFGGMLFVLLIVLILFGFMAIFLRGQFPVVRLIYACCGALLFSFFLIHDTQLMIGGNHKYSISPEEYIFAALTLYLDIINIFLYLLRIFGNK